MEVLVIDFKKWLEEKQKLSPSTVGVYLASIRSFFDYHKDNFTVEEFNGLEIELIQQYWFSLTFQNLPESLLKSRVYGLKKFNQYLIDKGLQESIVVDLDYKKISNITKVKSKKNPKEVDIYRFIDVVKKRGNIRDLAIIMIKLKTTLTVSEIVNIKMSDYKKTGVILIDEGKKTINLDNETQLIISEYLEERENFNYSSSRYLFISNRSEKLNDKYIFILFRRYSLQANFSSRITPKKLEKLMVPRIDNNDVFSSFCFTVEGKNEQIFFRVCFVTKNFYEDSFVKIRLYVSDNDNNEKIYQLVIAKPDIIDNFINGSGELFFAKGFLFTYFVSKEEIKKFIINLYNEGDYRLLTKKLESISMDNSTYEAIEKK
ncbi:tyrosine-type recombinase/integrase [Anaerobacillus isosaccharinicus]|uniref:Tyrosine-type recombinase/integrase n=1 Tax=Anaerobacillus isosaccharinicus TaxID=1532552 RepID=A0A1S2M7K4_9BACI|nr:tyrosine-type recombinase/integrase [Anaerobacillus isosaccharinicus]MBA5587085.1 tyrosine-type recombinase/integrase [Anaerobacillus isosaccharinicus]QOY34719.1 tyrosine-type recombinase/integrase [Anaerobacillus isosaccharinicus]